MTERKCVTRSGNSRTNRCARIKDEVYRQMYRLEESRPGSKLALALALLHAWLNAEAKPENSDDQDWLKKISPICLEMIESSLKAGKTGRPFVQ